MNGPEHYREAEKFLAYAHDLYSKLAPGADGAAQSAAVVAQVHATLALAAATATLDAIEGPNGGSATGRSVDDWRAWRDALGGGVS